MRWLNPLRLLGAAIVLFERAAVWVVVSIEDGMDRAHRTFW